MRTTLSIDSGVLSEYKRLAADSHRTLSRVIEDVLRQHLAARRAAGGADGDDLPVVRGGSLLPGVDLDDNAAVQTLVDEGLPLDRLR